MSSEVLGLPRWPAAPGPVDPAGASYLVVALGAHPGTTEVAARWVRLGERRAPTRSLTVAGIDGDRAAIVRALEEARTGVRILVVGPQYDVLLTLALAREHGAGPAELSCFVVDAGSGPTALPVFCAHCRATHRVVGEPGGEVTCPGCSRRLEIHPHHSARGGSFLASDARARELA